MRIKINTTVNVLLLLLTVYLLQTVTFRITFSLSYNISTQTVQLIKCLCIFLVPTLLISGFTCLILYVMVCFELTKWNVDWRQCSAKLIADVWTYPRFAIGIKWHVFHKASAERRVAKTGQFKFARAHTRKLLPVAREGANKTSVPLNIPLAVPSLPETSRSFL